jgi:hypothetical protein
MEEGGGVGKLTHSVDDYDDFYWDRFH